MLAAIGENILQSNAEIIVKMFSPEPTRRCAMVEAFTTTDCYTIVCRPNKSLPWRQAKLFLLIVTLWSMGIGTGFLLVGAWPVLPFMGLEIGCLAVALYYVQWKLAHQEVIRISQHEIKLEYGLHWPKFQYCWPRGEVRFALAESESAYLPPEITLIDGCSQRAIRVGKNLNEDDLKKLVELLRSAQIPVRSAKKVSQQI